MMDLRERDKPDLINNWHPHRFSRNFYSPIPICNLLLRFRCLKIQKRFLSPLFLYVSSLTMSYSKRSRRFSRSVSRSLSPESRSLSRERSRSGESIDAENPGNNLYVTGLSHRITKRDIEKHFSSEGRVEDVHLVVDPWTRESRGFGFVTMSTLEEANSCVKYLDSSVLDGRVITVEKARRRRGRTPTPGRYLGLRTVRGCHRSRSNSPRQSRSYSSRRSPSYSSYQRSRSPSPRYSSERDRSRSYSPSHSRRRSYSPYDGSRRSYSPYHRRHGQYYRSSYHRRSPSVSRRDLSYSPYGSRDYSPDDRYYRRHYYRSGRSVSRSMSPRSWRRSYSPERSRRGYSPSVSPRPRRSKRRSVSSQSYSSRSPSASSRSVTPWGRSS